MKNNFLTFVERVRQMLAEGAVNAACATLFKCVKNDAVALRNEVIQLSSRLNGVLKKYEIGTLAYTEMARIQSEVCHSVLVVLESLKEDDVDNNCISQEKDSIIETIYRQEKIYKNLEKTFLPFKSAEERTQKIIEDLGEILESPQSQLENTTIWTTSFLSIFSVEKDDPYYKGDEKLLELLNEEKDKLIALASKGCKIKCIISPANTKYRSQNVEYGKYRTRNLKKFLEDCDEIALSNIEWAASEYTQGNVYILGEKAIYFGYKKGNDPLGKSYDFTLRHTNEYVINSHSNIYETFFENLSCINLANWHPNEKLYYNANTLRRKAVISILEKSIKFLDGLQSFETDL